MTSAQETPRRFLRLSTLIVMTVVLALLCCTGGVVSYFIGGLDGETDNSAFGCGREALVDPNGNLPRTASLSDEQMHNAAVIIKVGQQMNVPPRGWVVATATAMQESWLRNLPNLGANNDHDSVGLFQQRPSQGWGTVDQIMNPEYSSRKFYEKLLTVDGWLTMALTDAAQAVQRSAYPDAYAKHEPTAAQVVNVLTGGAGRAVGGLTDLRCLAGAGEISASGWTNPIRGTVGSGYRTASRPTHQGVDIMAAKGTPIYAATAGIVIKARCNAIASDGSNWGCDRDGSPYVRGCGWYVDILHAGAVVTRYCHMVSRPFVSAGQPVLAGQEIGRTGSSGHSSGPHLHFEVHTNGDTTSNGAIDPVRFMREMGAPLGSAP